MHFRIFRSISGLYVIDASGVAPTPPLPHTPGIITIKYLQMLSDVPLGTKLTLSYSVALSSLGLTLDKLCLGE